MFHLLAFGFVLSQQHESNKNSKFIEPLLLWSRKDILVASIVWPSRVRDERKAIDKSLWVSSLTSTLGELLNILQLMP